MKTTLFSVASAAVVSLASTASAQSVLERVLGTVDNATNLSQVNGTYANIAESVGAPVFFTETRQAGFGDAAVVGEPVWFGQVWEGDDETGSGWWISTDDLGTTIIPETSGLSVPITVGMDGSVSFPEEGSESLEFYGTATAWQWEPVDAGDVVGLPDDAVIVLDDDTSYYFVAPAHFAEYPSVIEEIVSVSIPRWTAAVEIDGSITNIVDGIDGATQEAIAGIDVSAIEWDMATLNFGDMATTALGAVNTGDITLGVNSAIDEAATSTTRAISAVVEQIGGSADAGAIVLNVASNMNAVNGSINNALMQVNGSIGDLSTTALGAVNTGVIISGVDATVQGIVGMSGATNAALN